MLKCHAYIITTTNKGYSGDRSRRYIRECRHYKGKTLVFSIHIFVAYYSIFGRILN